MQQYQQYQPQYIPVAVQSGGYGYGGGLGGFGGGLGGGGGGFGGGLMSLLFFSKYSYNILHTQFKWWKPDVVKYLRIKTNNCKSYLPLNMTLHAMSFIIIY